jgi:hypothetical protein
MDDQKKEIYKEIVKILKLYKKGMRERTDGESKYELSGEKKIHVLNKDIDGMYFASVVIQKNFVGFYFFPQYCNPKLISLMPENLKKCLKGKTCFHIKKKDAEIMKSIKSFAKIGYDSYKKMEWI